MSKSLLLTIAQDSITEVFEAKNIINRKELLADYPILDEPLACFIHIYIDDEICGSSGSFESSKSLLESIIYHAKVAAFQNNYFGPLKVSQYLHATIELSLLTPPSEINYNNMQDLESKVSPFTDGLTLCLEDKCASFLPMKWSEFSNFKLFLAALLEEADIFKFSNDIKIYSFQVEKQRKEPILD